MKYEIVTFEGNRSSLKCLRTGENMHSSIGPLKEAMSVYIEQAKLVSTLLLETPEPLVLYDVGLGIGANALATIDEFLKCLPCRDLHIISFENNLDGLEFALETLEQFPFLKNHENLVRCLLRNRIVHPKLRNKKLQWELKEGDFRHEIASSPAPEIIYYDLYSPKTSPELWGYKSFQLLFEKTEERRMKGLDTSLSTYCSSTAVRAAMLLAGLRVGRGSSTSKKRETTVAATQFGKVQAPLDLEWFEHWKRSSRPLPEDYMKESFQATTQKILDLIL